MKKRSLSVRDIRARFITPAMRSAAKRIVGEIDELMARYDRLETNLTAIDASRRRLFDAILVEAPEPPPAREREQHDPATRQLDRWLDAGTARVRHAAQRAGAGRDVLERVVSGRTKNHKLDVLMPWTWKAARDSEAASAA
jgi:hypothetical protein